MLFAAQCAAPCCRLLRMTHTVFLCSTRKREFPAGQRQHPARRSLGRGVLGASAALDVSKCFDVNKTLGGLNAGVGPD